MGERNVDEITTPEESGTGIDRRTLIRNAGIVGAAAWTMPIVSSFAARAYAASVPGCAFEAGADSCSGQTPCGADGRCYCNRNVTNGAPNGTTYCTVPTQCENQDCASNSDCPSGQVCQATCCGSTKCFVVCGDGAGAAAGESYLSAPQV